MRVTHVLCALLLCSTARAVVVESPAPLENAEIPVLPAALVPVSPLETGPASSLAPAAPIDVALPPAAIPSLAAGAAEAASARESARPAAQSARASAQRAFEG